VLQAFSASINGGDAALEPLLGFNSIALQGVVAGQAGLDPPNLFEIKRMLVCILGLHLLQHLAQSEYGLGIIAMGDRDIGLI